MGTMNGKSSLDFGMSRRQFLQGAVAVGAVTTFGDAGDAAPAVRFGFITDCHYAAHIKPSRWRNHCDGLLKMDVFAAKMNELGVDFVVEGGDFKDLGRTPAESLAYLREIEGRFAAFKGPRYHVLGNHDHDNISKEEFLAEIANEGQPKAKAFYSFVRNGITFVVLDACYRPDGVPYCRGKFFWKDAFLPAEQVEFLRTTLAAAKGPCVPIVHQQLDAEDETCIRNAAEVRSILEKSGKVKLVVQGHLHEGSFREVNGIGYFTSPASMLNPASSDTFSLIEIYPSGGAKVTGFNVVKGVATSWVPGAWTAEREWRKGHYQVHYIYTGRSECMFHIFPDGTSMLLDCGDSMRFFRTPAEVPLPSSPSVRAGEFAAKYILRVNPKGDKVDYLHLSHYHEDHGGGERFHGGPLGRSSLGEFNRCGIADAARFLKFGCAVDRAWPGFDDPMDVLKTSRDGTPRQMRALYAHLAETQGTKIERFALGSREQFRPGDAAACRDFKVFNLCANGRFVRPDGTVCDLYANRAKAGVKVLNENGMSCGMVVEYGEFRYFTAGDFSDGWKHADGVRREIEDALAEAVGRVHVAKLNHHGHHSMSPGLVKALKARVWTCCTLDQQHCTDDTMCRLADRSLYDGPRLMLPTYMPLNRPQTPDGRGYLSDVARCAIDQPCHVVLDVPPGGESYTFSCFSATQAGSPLKGEFTFWAL